MNKTDQALTLFEPKSIDELKDRAALLVKSGILPSHVKSPEAAIAIAMIGRELGLPMMESFRSIYVIQGTPSIRPQTMLALIQRSGQLEYMKIEEASHAKPVCVVTMKRRGQDAYAYRFSWEDAARMKTTEWSGQEKKTIPLTEKYNWKTMPWIMLKWRAISGCARIVFPDVINGMYTPEEVNPAGVEVGADEAVQVVAVEPGKEEMIPTGIFNDKGRELRIDEIDEVNMEHFVIPDVEWEGKDYRFKGKTLMQIFTESPDNTGRTPGLVYLHKVIESYPVENVRDLAFKFMSHVHPGYIEGLPQPPVDDGWEPVDPESPKITQAQKDRIGAICEAENIDFDGLFAGQGINPKTVTQQQAQRMINKFRAVAKHEKTAAKAAV